MKTLSNFVDEYVSNSSLMFEARRKKTEEDVDIEDVMGKPADKNGSHGVWGISEPVDDEAMEDIDLNSPDNTEAMEDLIDKFDAEEDFFIQGEAGWGKTSIIEALARKYKRKVITVYLDKAEATDLGGIPVPVQGKTGAVQDIAMPGWAKIMEDNPDDKFLLFFDEMNQADPGVMNALMPIVLKHEVCGRQFGPKVKVGNKWKVKHSNFFVGAAGNFDYENKGGISELSGPLKSRFKPIIKWESGGAAWKSAFGYLHKKYDQILGKELVDMFEDNAELFYNPREIEHKIFKFMIAIKENGDLARNKASKYLRRLDALAKEELSRDQKNALSKLAESIASYIAGEIKGEESGRRKKDSDMISTEDKEIVKLAMEKGYLIDEESGVKYGFSRENINTMIPDDMNQEMFERLVKNLERSGVKFKYEKDSEWKKKGYKDPAGDD